MRKNDHPKKTPPQRGPHISTAKIKQYAVRCKTPRQFEALLKLFQILVPYRCLVYGWGYHPDFVLAFWGDRNYPPEYVDYYVHESVLRKDTVFAEWVRTQKCQIWNEVLDRLGEDQFDPKYLRMTKRYELDHTLTGGHMDGKVASYFAVAMHSDDACWTHFEDFQACIMALCKALRRSFAKPKLTAIQLRILNLLSHGYIQKEVTDILDVNFRFLTAQLEDARLKLHARTTTEAAVKAFTTGILTSPPSLATFFPASEEILD